MTHEADDIFLTTAQLKKRYGGVSDMCIHRWVRNPDLGFPQPIKINQRKLWRLSDLISFEARSTVQRLRGGRAA